MSLLMRVNPYVLDEVKQVFRDTAGIGPNYLSLVNTAVLEILAQTGERTYADGIILAGRKNEGIVVCETTLLGQVPFMYGRRIEYGPGNVGLFVELKGVERKLENTAPPRSEGFVLLLGGDLESLRVGKPSFVKEGYRMENITILGEHPAKKQPF
ncbi:hypothetical protein HYU13_03930 [Candidatus Woesearchaeota archaeon]|nr:hypothetical protein [Candidatus Woesearchaeota archaeon]